MAAPLFAVVFFLVEADFLGTAFFVVAASFLTGVFLGVLVDFLTVVDLSVFAFAVLVVVVRPLALEGARTVALATDFLAGTLAVVAFSLVVAVFETGFLKVGFVF